MAYLIIFILSFNVFAQRGGKLRRFDFRRETDKVNTIVNPPTVCPTSVHKSLTIDLDYYGGENGKIPYAIMCLSAGTGLIDKRGESIFAQIGHSALNVFTLDQLQRDRLMTTDKVAYGFWPIPEVDKSDENEKVQEKEKKTKFYLQEDNHKDQFFKFHSGRYKEAANFCVAITKEQKQDLDDFIAGKKGEKWSMFENCNDVTSKAFFKICGIDSFNFKSFITTPMKVLGLVRKENEKRGGRTQKFSYKTTDPEEIGGVLSYMKYQALDEALKSTTSRD